MKNNIKSMVLGLIVGCMITSVVSVFAYNGTENIKATFKNIKIFVDGSELTPRDSSGNVLEPFIYNGSTYLPVRAVAEAVGKDVSYDSNTNTVYIGKNNSSISGNTYISPYQIEDGEEENATMGGKTYRNAIILTQTGWPDRIPTAYYNLGGNYSSMSGLYGYVDGTNSGISSTICFYGDGKLLKEINVESGQLPKTLQLMFLE